MFILDKPFTDKGTFVYLLTQCDDGRLKLSTRLKIIPAAWSTETERPKINKDGKGKTTFTLLNRVAEALDRLRDECRLNQEAYTRAKVQAAALRILGGKEKVNIQVTFSEAVELITGKMRNGELLTNRNRLYDKATIYNYSRMGAEIVRFSKETGISVAFAATSMDTYNGFKAWAYNQAWSINYTGCFLKTWKGILSNAYKIGLHKNEIHTNRDFKIISEKTDDIYLTLSDIKDIQDVDLTGEDKRWSTARDWFLIACFSALRASDLKRITKEQITKTSLLLATEKTDEITEIPIHPVVAGILKKHGGPPPYMHQNDINEFIKFVARKAKLNDTFLYVITKGGKRKEEYFKKWQMCSCHTARRSFITNARLLGMPDSLIMKVAAIKSAKTLALYDKMTTGEAARQAAKHLFFQG